MATTFESFVKLVSDRFGIPEDLITKESVFTKEFGIDSLSLFSFISDIEKHYQIKLPIKHLTQINTVGKAYNIVASLT